MFKTSNKTKVKRSKFIYYTGWILLRIFGLIFNAKYQGSSNIPSSGPFILASNHRHSIDPLLLASAIFREVYFFAKKELWNNKMIGWLISKGNAFPVKRGANDRGAFRETKNTLLNNNGLVFFPEGKRSRDDNFLKPKPGIGMILKQANIPVPIIPAYIHASNHLLDCLLRRKQLTIIIGNPIPSEEILHYLTDKDGYQALAEKVMTEITTLQSNANFSKQAL